MQRLGQMGQGFSRHVVREHHAPHHLAAGQTLHIDADACHGSGFLLRSHRPRHVDYRPAGRVGPGGVGDAAPLHVSAQGFHGHGALGGALDGGAAVGGDLSHPSHPLAYRSR
jgi:hypothetical protein